MLITYSGLMVRTAVDHIRETGRVTQGVKLINLREGDKLQAIAPVIIDDDEEEVDGGEVVSEDGTQPGVESTTESESESETPPS